MKIVNKENGRTIAKGRFELSKVSDIEIVDEGVNTWAVFQYFTVNLIKKSDNFSAVLHMVAEITVKDSLINIEASELDFDTGMRAAVQLTTEERERFFIYIINTILGKVTQ